MSILYDGTDPKTNSKPDVSVVFSVGFSDSSRNFCIREQRNARWRSDLTTRGSYPSFADAYRATKLEAQHMADSFRVGGTGVSVGLIDQRDNAIALQGVWGLSKLQAKELASFASGMEEHSHWSEIRNDFFETQAELTRPEDKGKLAQISIDAYKTPDDNEQGKVIARVILSKHGDIMVDYHDNAARMDAMAQDAINEAKEQLSEYFKAFTVFEKCEAHQIWLESQPYRKELLDLLKDNGMGEDVAFALADAITDLVEEGRQPTVQRAPELPDELVVRMAHYAGELEAKGEISAPEWDDLCSAIRDAIHIYYDEPSESNPFHIEDVMDKILRERFPAEPQPDRESEPVLKDLVALVCTHETKYGINKYVSLHPDSKSALAAVEAVKEETDFDESNAREYFDYDLDFLTIDVSTLQDHKEKAHERQPLSDMINDAQSRSSAQQAGQGRPPEQPER